MKLQEECELVLRAILDAVSKGHKVSIQITEEEEHNSDRWVAVEATNYLCLLSYLGNFEQVIHGLAQSVDGDVYSLSLKKNGANP